MTLKDTDVDVHFCTRLRLSATTQHFFQNQNNKRIHSMTENRSKNAFYHKQHCGNEHTTGARTKTKFFFFLSYKPTKKLYQNLHIFYFIKNLPPYNLEFLNTLWLYINFFLEI